MNSAFNLGEAILEPKIFRKVLRSLPERFHAKITVIEKSKDINKIPLIELVGNLQTYKLGLTRIGKLGKSKSMALNAKGSDTEESFDEEDSKIKSYITRQFKKISSTEIAKEACDYQPMKEQRLSRIRCFRGSLQALKRLRWRRISHSMSSMPSLGT